MFRPITRFLRDRRAATAVEFAFVFPLLLALMILILQLGVSYYYSSIVQASAFQLARSIQASSAPPTSQSDANAIVSGAPGMGGQIPTVVVEPLAGATSTTTEPAANGFTTPVPGQPFVVTVLVPRPQFLPLGALQAVFPMLFGANIVYTVVATP